MYTLVPGMLLPVAVVGSNLPLVRQPGKYVRAADRRTEFLLVACGYEVSARKPSESTVDPRSTDSSRYPDTPDRP